MTRPLALIEGDLTIPLPRPFDGLPPPFGFRRNVMREAVQQAVHPAAKPARASRFPPGVKHVLFYKAPPRRAQTYNVDALMKEAKRYLDMGKVRPRSSRSDHLLAASIFAGCTIALTWLLVTCSMKDAEKAKAVVPKVLAAASPRGDRVKPGVKPSVADTQTQTASTGKTMPQTVAAVASEAPATVATTGSPVVAQVTPLSFVVPKLAAPKQSARVAAHGEDTVTSPSKPAKRVKVATLSEAHVNERMIMSRSTHPATRPTPSTQPEWTAKPQHDVAATTDDAPWLTWSAQQQRPSMRAAVPVPGDNHWNDHMTQRRITDDPAAFHVERNGQ